MPTLSFRHATGPLTAAWLACLVAVAVALAGSPALARAEPVPGIDITLTQKPGPETGPLRTNDAGQVRLTLRPGTYTVDVVDPRQVRDPIAITVNVKGVRGVTSATLPPYGGEDWRRYAAEKQTARGYITANGGGAFEFTVPPGKPLPVAITVRTAATATRGDAESAGALQGESDAERQCKLLGYVYYPSGRCVPPPRPGEGALEAAPGAYESYRGATAPGPAVQGQIAGRVCAAPTVWNPERQACEAPAPAN